MFTRSFPLFTIFGFRISIDLSWFVLAALIVWSLATGLFPESLPERSAQTSTSWGSWPRSACLPRSFSTNWPTRWSRGSTA